MTTHEPPDIPDFLDRRLKPKTKPTGWRDVLPIHPAAELFPLMSAEELKALGEDIKKYRLYERVTLYGSLNAVETWQLLDGRNRLDAMELVGLPVLSANGTIQDDLWAVRPDGQVDPYEFVLSANAHRRHLTPEQKREIIAKVIKAQPEKSNRTIAKQIKADHKTVGAVRAKLEDGGEIPHHDLRQDARGTMQPAHKPPPKTQPVPAAADIRDGKARKMPTREPAPLPDDAIIQGNSEEERWQRSLMNLAGDAVSMPAFWTREFGKWDAFAVSSDMVTLAEQAAAQWQQIVADLKRRKDSRGGGRVDGAAE